MSEDKCAELSIICDDNHVDVNQSVTNGVEKGATKIENAYERSPVEESSFKGWLSFLALYTSRHTAGTEFAIGPLFVARGATAIDVIVGLLIGNCLATLSWRFICAPIATRQRLTAYYSMERIVGRKLMYVYDITAFLVLALLAGAMFTVSASAVGVPFGVPAPGLNDWLPASFSFCVVVVFCGLVTTLVASFGITFVTVFGQIVTPILLAGIIYMCIQSLQMLGINDDFGHGLWYILSEKVYTGVVVDLNFTRVGFGKCVFFAWFCDLQLHIGQNDLTLIRYAKSANAGGWSSGAGMFVGHYFAWITAGLMYAVQLQADPTLTSVSPGPIAQLVGGWFGIIIIVIAGWSTANPIMYAAGLGLQHVVPRLKTWASTLLVGSIATAAALFPGFTSRILELLSFAGLILCPMGVIVFCDFFILPAMGLPNEQAANSIEGMASATNWRAVIAWFVSVAITTPIAFCTVLEFFYTPLITIILAGALYVGSSKIVIPTQKCVLAIADAA